MRKQNRKRMKTLSAREEMVMNILWDKGPMFVQDMLELLPEPLHFNTVSTFVRGLEKKGLVGHKTYGISHQYYAVVSREEFNKKTLKSVIGKYFNNSYLGMVSSLVKEEEISLDELKELIREVENAHKK